MTNQKSCDTKVKKSCVILYQYMAWQLTVDVFQQICNYCSVVLLRSLACSKEETESSAGKQDHH
jgi:hypothetical protein